VSARLIVAAMAAAVLVGCTDKPGADAPATDVAAPGSIAAPPAEPAPTASAPRRVRGNAIVGKDGYGVVPCGETSQLVFAVDATAQPFLDKFLEGGAHEFFLDAWIEDNDAGRPVVTRFERLYTEGEGCKESLEQVRFAARGTEPFWSVVDGAGGLKLERPGEEQVQAEASWREESGGIRIADAKTKAGKFELRLAPGMCSDGMSDALYGWTASARLDKWEFAGCGFAGLAP